MSHLLVEPVDAHDDTGVDEFHDVYLAAELAIGPGVAFPWMREEVRVMLQERHSRRLADGFVARLGG